MADVAKSSGVSLTTVSFVLNQKPGIPHETRIKVLNAANALGYQLKNVDADEKRDLSSQIRVVGAFVKSQLDDPTHPASNVFYSHVLAGIEENCRLHNLLLMLSAVRVDFNSFPLEIPRLLQSCAIDAILLVGVCVNEILDVELRQAALPIILVDAYSYIHEYDSVTVKNYEAGYRATNYLIQQGHRQIAFVGSSENSHPSFVDRRRGYLQALQDKEITEHYIGYYSYNNPQAVLETLHRMKQESPQISAVMACNDKVAIELMQAAKELGIAVPGEISIVGFDNIALADKIATPLTTMDIDKISMGRLAVETILFRSRFPETAVTQVSLFPTLIERQSVRQF
jgi:LacI family transcriptional regulator